MTGYLREETRSAGRWSETPHACGRRRKGGGAFDEKGQERKKAEVKEKRGVLVMKERPPGTYVLGKLLHRFRNPTVGTR